MLSPPTAPNGENRKVTSSYGARAHVEWLLSLDVLWHRVYELGEEGRTTRRNGRLAWREAGDGPVIEIGDPKRYRREWLAAQRSLAAVFPESQRGIVPALVRNPRAEIVVPAGPTIRDAKRVRRLQAECLRRLERLASRDVRAQDNERKALAAALTAIDPGRRPLTVLDDGEFLASPAPGDLVNVHATWAGDGIFRAVASARGVPPLGTFATIADTTMYVELPPVRGNGRGPRRNDPLIQLD